MNAYSTIRQPTLSEAIAQASDWVRVAKPVILAYFAMDEIDSALRSAAYDFRGDKRWNEPKGHEERTMDEARAELRPSMANLMLIVEGIRDNFICDATPQHPSGDDEAEWDAHEEFREALEAGVPGVVATVKKIGDEL